MVICSEIPFTDRGFFNINTSNQIPSGLKIYVPDSALARYREAWRISLIYLDSTLLANIIRDTHWEGELILLTKKLLYSCLYRSKTWVWYIDIFLKFSFRPWIEESLNFKEEFFGKRIIVVSFLFLIIDSPNISLTLAGIVNLF